MDDDDDGYGYPREPYLDLRPPDYFLESFWQQPPPPLPPPQLHPEPNHVPAYFAEENNDGPFMLGGFHWETPVDGDPSCRFGELDLIGEGGSASASASSSMLSSSLPSTSTPTPIGAAASSQSEEEIPADAEVGDERSPDTA